jgi:hypothetical protein
MAFILLNFLFSANRPGKLLYVPALLTVSAFKNHTCNTPFLGELFALQRSRRLK